MAGIVARKFETSLCKLAAAKEFTPYRFDVSSPDAAHIKKLISEVVTQYQLDFPSVAPAPQSGLIGRVDVDSAPSESCAHQGEVQLEAIDISADRYRVEMMAFNESVDAHQKRVLDNYINTNAALVVDDGTDIERRKRKLIQLPVAAEKSGNCS